MTVEEMFSPVQARGLMKQRLPGHMVRWAQRRRKACFTLNDARSYAALVEVPARSVTHELRSWAQDWWDTTRVTLRRLDAVTERHFTPGRRFWWRGIL